MRVLSVAALIAAVPASAAGLINPVFQDHAVLQRDQPIRIWGTASPNARITATLGTNTAEAVADAQGRWHSELSAMTAGGPYTLKLTSSDGTSQTLSDLLIGDVYLCSGQSNMAFRAMEAIDAGPDIQVSANDAIRLMSVANITKATPQTELPKPGTWGAAEPKTVVNFSAACYFFGRELQKSAHVPLGLIQSAWSGANITSFMSAEVLKRAGGNDMRLDALAIYAHDPKEGVKHWGEIAESYWTKKLGYALWKAPEKSATWAVAPKDLGIWTEWGVPALAHYAGHVWFRTSVSLTEEQAKQAATLSLGTITEEDQTWVNGAFIASTFGYGEPRKYELKANTLHAGDNDILIDVYCGWRGCGMFGAPEARAITLADGSSVKLNGSWRYLMDATASTPRIPWGATAGITMAYNGMIAPLGDLGLKGVLWYQGESNSSEPEAYRGLLKEWMADWRQQFKAPNLPFLIVQLPDYGLPPFKPEESDWARLRESQRLAVNEDGHAGLAVTIDIGDHMGLHPSNKQEVGRRLAQVAKRVVYGDANAKSGPAPQSVTRKGGVVTVRFSGINGKLAAVNAADPIGFELCDSKACQFTPAHIQGETVTIAVPKGLTPTKLRYCWGDGPVCTLYDSSRLPAVPFESKITP
nr:sialate O-acetylesterase [Rhizomicrobium palustre]